MPHHQFWSQLVNDRVLHRRLGQLIQNLPRRWQLKQHKTIQKSESGSESVCQAMLDDLLRDTFLVFVRMSTPKESPEHFISPEFYGRLVYDNFLWDVPRSSHKNTHLFQLTFFSIDDILQSIEVTLPLALFFSIRMQAENEKKNPPLLFGMGLTQKTIWQQFF